MHAKQALYQSATHPLLNLSTSLRFEKHLNIYVYKENKKEYIFNYL